MDGGDHPAALPAGLYTLDDAVAGGDRTYALLLPERISLRVPAAVAGTDITLRSRSATSSPDDSPWELLMTTGFIYSLPRPRSTTRSSATWSGEVDAGA